MNRQKRIIVISSLCLLLCLCVGYAAFNTQLSIRAKGNVKEKYAADLLKENIVFEGDGLYKDEYEEGSYVYKGANPNNYIEFNDEVWRIISINEDNSLKIIRNEIMNNEMLWDSDGSNEWEASDIKAYLNGDYLKNINTQNITPYSWSIGSIEENNNDLSKQISDENKIKSESSYVGLMRASEYLRANSNVKSCGTYALLEQNSTLCKNTNWMSNMISNFLGVWTITPMLSAFYDLGSDDYYTENTVVFTGMFISFRLAGSKSNGTINDVLLSYLPVVNLTSSIKLQGTGSSSDPYCFVN